MESNASLHGDATAGETGGNGANAELSVSSLGPSCTTSATTTITTTTSPNASASANAASRADRANVCETLTMEAGGKLVQGPGNGMGHGACESAAGNDDAQNSKLVNMPSREEPSVGTTSARADLTDQEVQEVSSVCADSSAAKAKSKSGSNEGTLSQGLPSLESLESFSNLNSSCPSSEPVSEGLEDQEKGLAAVPQGQHGAEGGKAQSCRDRAGAGQSLYHIKWIRWKEENTPIITQNENGPCPLLAIMNVLLLAWKVINSNNTSYRHPQKSFASVPEHHSFFGSAQH